MEKKFKLFKIPTVNRQSTDGQSLRQYSVSTRLFRLAALFTLLFTIAVGQMWGTRLFQTGQKVYFQDATLTSTMSGKRWKSDTNGNVYAYFFNQKDHVGDNDVTNWAEGAGKLVYGTDGAANAIYEFTVPSLPSGGDGVWWGVIFTRGTAASWDGRWNQTTNQYPADGKSLFTIADNKDGSNWTGNWSVMPEMLCSTTSTPWSKEDGIFFTDYSGEKGIVKINCTASQSFQFIVFDGTYYKSYADETNTTWADYGPKTDGGYNFQFTAGEAGEYVFQWDKTNHKLWVWEPKARLAKQKYVYFDARNLKGSGTDYWQYSDFTARFWFKYYDSGSNKGSVDCTKASALEDWVYYALVPDDDYLGRIQMNKMNGGSVACEAGLVYAKDRESLTQNCLKEESGKENWCTSWTPQWTTYCPPTTSETFADNSTTKISWQPNTNDGSTSAKAIWVKTGTTLKVAATASKAVADDNMTIKYDFKVDGSSQQNTTTATYTHSASTNNTTYELSADIYTNYNLDNTKNSTKHTQSSIFYKALNTYSVTHTLSGVTKASGREGTDAAAYYVAYDATYTANAGYYLPSDITVTIGGVTKTKGTDYTWTVTDGTSGTLNILSSKIDGDVVVTINGIWRWSVAGSWKVITPGEGDPYWDPDTYTLEHIGTNASSKDTCYVEVTLAANTTYTFDIVDRSTSPYTYHKNGNDKIYYMTYGNSTNWGFGTTSGYNYDCGITTAGAGTYRFAYNITDDGKVTVTYPASYQVTAAGNPAAGGTVAPASATYMSTEVGGEITATPNYSHYFNGWTSNAGGSFTNASAATTTFKPASADATVTAAFAERTAFIEGNFQVYNSLRGTRTKTGDSWQDESTNIKMTYDAVNNRYYLHTYSTPAELAEQLNNADAYFYIKTSTSSSSIANDATYKAYASAYQSLATYGSSNKQPTGSSEHSFKFTGSEDGYVIIYFNGTSVWYELECALSYYGGEGATGDAPAERAYYAYDSNQTAASNSYSKTGYTFDHWDTAADDSGSDYAAGATNVAMNAHEVCLHAMWTINNHNITYTAPSHGSYTIKAGDASAVSADISDVDYNTTITLAATPASGYTFTSWSLTGATAADASSANTTFSMPDNDVTVAATFTEITHTVSVAVSPSGAGTFSYGGVSSLTSKSITGIGVTTATTDIVATPTHEGWRFKEWQYDGEKLTKASGSGATIAVNASDDATITAVFEPRFGLLASENDGSSTASGTTPGWTPANSADFTVYDFDAKGTGEGKGVDFRCAVTMLPNRDYKFQVYDRERNAIFGTSDAVDQVTVAANASVDLTSYHQYGEGENHNRDVLVAATGYGTYTFRITNIADNSYLYPTVTIDRQSSAQVHTGWRYTDGNGDRHEGNTGGTITATTTEDDQHFTVTDMQFVAKGGDVIYEATPASGYEFAGWYHSTAYNDWFTNDNPWTDINISADHPSAYALFRPKTMVFNAATNSNWGEATNWTDNTLPTIDHDVVITKPVTVDIAHATAKSIVIDQNGDNTGKLTIQANKGLEVAGTITKTTDGETYSATTSSDLLLESSSAGNATLIFDNSNSDQATVQMYSKGWTTGTQGSGTWNWQFVGVPVTDATRINDYYNGYMYEWNTSTRTWDDVTNTDATLSTFKAYSVSYPTDEDHLHTYSIDGTLAATTNQTIDVAAGQTVQAAANSWTAPIRINNITSTNWSPATIFLYNTGYNPKGSAAGKGEVLGDRYAAGKYLPIPVSSAPYLGESYIAPMQGFLFKNTKSVSDGTITLNYSSAVRTDGSEGIVAGAMHAPQRQMEAEPVVMKIYVSDSLYDDRVVLLAREDFSRGFDNGWDGEKFQVNAVTTAPRLFAINETGGKEEVSAIPELENTVIGFRPGTEETYTIHFDYNGDETLYLRDTRTGSSTLITNESKYIFLSDGTNEDARFIISRVQSTPTGVEETGAGSKAYKLMIEDHIYIIRDGRMYSVDGALVNLERK